MNSILPGGCYPPHWPAPPTCYPPLPPPTEPDPDSLDAVVDWMTYPHPRLYRMVHQGLDLTGAMEVSAQWARLGEDLTDIATTLGEIVNSSAAAWEGPAADLARQTLSALTHWAEDTGVLATKVSGCVTIEVDNATNARDEMPAPRLPEIETPTPVPQPIEAFTMNDWGTAAAITADPAGPLMKDQALHEQAARTMERFQVSSREVYETVPRFSPPAVGETLYTLPDEPPPPPPPQPPQPTTPQSNPPVTTTPPGAPAPPGGAGTTGTPERPAVAPAAPPGAGPVPGPVPGVADPAGRNQPAAASASGRPGSVHPGIGGMPMAAGAGAAGGAEDAVRKGLGLLKEEDDVWGERETPTTPPVIGEVNRRA